MQFKYLSFTVFIFCVFQANAQYKLSQQMAERCTDVKAIQAKGDGKTFTDARSKTSYKVTFPADNFNILFSTGLAYQATYRQSAESSNEQLYLTEDIDMSKGIKVIPYEVKNSALFRISIEFPKNSITTKVIENGQLINTIQCSTVDFYCLSSADGRQGTLQRTLAELVYDVQRWKRETGKK